MKKGILLILLLSPIIMFGDSFAMRLGAAMHKASGTIPVGTETKTGYGFVGGIFYQLDFMEDGGIGFRPELRYLDTRSEMKFSDAGDSIDYSVKNVDIVLPVHYSFTFTMFSIAPSAGFFGGLSFDETDGISAQNPRAGLDASLVLEFKLGLGAPRLGIEAAYSRTFTNIFEDSRWDKMVWHGFLLTFFIKYDSTYLKKNNTETR